MRTPLTGSNRMDGAEKHRHLHGSPRSKPFGSTTRTGFPHRDELAVPFLCLRGHPLHSFSPTHKGCGALAPWCLPGDKKRVSEESTSAQTPSKVYTARQGLERWLDQFSENDNKGTLTVWEFPECEVGEDRMAQGISGYKELFV
jgi:hypothetical protein